jgi:hypothetical protein
MLVDVSIKTSLLAELTWKTHPVGPVDDPLQAIVWVTPDAVRNTHASIVKFEAPNLRLALSATLK